MEMMNIMLFGLNEKTKIHELKKLILKHLPGVNVRPVISEQELLEILSRPLNNISVLICFIRASKEMDQLISLKPLLTNIRLILVLHSHSGKILESGLRLTPSFITYSGNDLMNIISVLTKIKEKEINRHGIGMYLGKN